MKIPYKHLLSRLEDSPKIGEISDKLFQLGHEHEIFNEIFDFELTPNRGDCLSLNGIIRELSIFYKTKSKQNIFQGDIEDLDLNFENHAIDICPQISFLQIEIDQETAEYKDYLESYFNDLGLNKNNFFTDISNYLSYETGQPTHCYDYKKINGKISFENMLGEYDFMTLLNQEIKIEDKNPVFKIKDELINLAGVIGGKSTACSKKTKSVLVECAYFKPEDIIGKTLKYNVQSDAAYKFERGVDFNNQNQVLRRFIKIVMDHANIVSMKIFSKKYKDIKSVNLPINVDLINKIIGINISESEYVKTLGNLGFTNHNQMIEPPSYRHDIFSQNDLAEEIARVIGYNNIQRKDLHIKNTNTKKNLNQIETKLRELLIDNGFFEVINFPFVKESTKNAIFVDNPLDTNKNHLRVCMKKSLVENLLYNERRQKDSIKLFEISNIYSHSSEINQETKIGIIASGRMGSNFIDFSKKINQKYFDNLLKKLIPSGSFVIEKIDRNKLDTKLKNEIFYTEIDINEFTEEILKHESYSSRPDKFVKYIEVSEFPSSTRDLSFSLINFDNLKLLEDTILNFQNNILKEVFIFDFYKNNKNNEIKLGFRFIFQSLEKTITDKEVEKVIDDIIKIALTIKGVKLPGL